MNLGALAARLGAAPIAPSDVIVRRARLDSREVAPGDVFVAVPGTTANGLRFARDAVRAGAVAVVAEEPAEGLGVPVLLVPNARAAAGAAAAALLGDPSRKLRVTGVTGTDGKTSTAGILRALLAAAGRRTGLSTTLGVDSGDGVVRPSGLTTPDAIAVQESLAAMLARGCAHAVIEASSHALDQARVDSVAFSSAVWTNLDAEHLDYHGTVEAYAAAKARLFALLHASPKPRKGIIGESVVRAGHLTPSPEEHWTFGIDAGDIMALDIRHGLTGTAFLLRTPEGDARIQTRFMGAFNVLNWLAAAGCALAEGVSLSQIADAAPGVAPAEGRLQRVDAGQPFGVIVDFAHTPHGLEAALAAVRPATAGRLILVFGMAGERDAANRPRAGAVAARNADVQIITMDDPYSEDPDEIAAAVAAGLSAVDPHAEYLYERDRGDAIRGAFALARPGDTVVITGRGHERAIVVGDRTIDFHDATVARQELARLGFNGGTVPL